MYYTALPGLEENAINKYYKGMYEYIPKEYV